MESESWTDASGLPLPQQQQQQPLSTQALPQQQQQQQLEPLHHQDQLDRQMLRHLLKKYSAAGISRLLEEEAASPDMRMCSLSSVLLFHRLHVQRPVLPQKLLISA
jgi:hypothetical protein